jgi:hypothetical protein
MSYGYNWKYLSAYLSVGKRSWFELAFDVSEHGVDMIFGTFHVTLHIWFGWN